MEEAELKNFVAGGIVVMDLHNWSVRWSVHLDLTTAGSSRTALIYSSPTVVDFDRDGESEILVGTSLGFVYALHSKDGSVVPGTARLPTSLRPAHVGMSHDSIRLSSRNGADRSSDCGRRRRRRRRTRHRCLRR